MESAPSRSLLSRVIALVPVTLCAAGLFRILDEHALGKMDSMPPAAYVEYHRRVFEHSFLFSFVALLVAGGIYLAALEIFSSLIRVFVPKSHGP